MNYWKQFAEMLGLELGQEFVLTDAYGNRKNKYTYKFTEDGLFSKANDLSVKVTLILDLLLMGECKAVPKPWKPKKGELYWFYSKTLNQAVSRNCYAENYALCLWKCGNCFRTEEEAKTKGKEIMEKLVKEYEEA